MNKKHYHFQGMIKENSKIGEKFRRFRQTKDVNMNRLKEKTSIDKSYLSNFERGLKNMPDDTIYLLLTKGMDLRPSEAEKLILRWRIEDKIGLLPPEDKVELMEVLFKQFMDEKFEIIPKRAIEDMRYITDFLEKRKDEEEQKDS